MKTTKTTKEKLAGLVRVISIPPVMVTALLLILYFWGPQPFCPVGELIITILLLGFVPVLAYPAQPLFPRYRSRRREGRPLCRLPCIGADGPLLRVHDGPQAHPLRCAKGQCKQPEAEHGGTERRKILSFHPLSLPAMSV